MPISSPQRLASAPRRTALLAVALLLVVPAATQAQETGGPPMPVVPGLQQNDAAPLEARGDSLLIGPCLNLTASGGATFQTPVNSEQLCGDAPGRVFSLEAEAGAIVAGLGRDAPGDVSAAAGFLLSTDGGASFTFAQPQLDAGVPEDNTVRYGVNAGLLALPALPVVVPEESAPFAVDYVDSTGAVWVAGRASGLRRSTDGLDTFERVVLPPDSLRAISPTQRYDFALRPRRGADGQFNHIVVSVLVDETGTVWAGTSAGVNRSRPEDVRTFEIEGTGEQFSDRAWRRFGFENTGARDSLAEGSPSGEGLSGNFVPVLAEQPLEGRRNPVWLSTRPTVFDGEERGVTFTRDGGETFYRTLLGERVNDFAFRGETAYAASERGLFISQQRTDTSYTWRLEQRFPGAEIPEAAVAKRRRVLSVATTTGALWAGTEDGLLRSTDGGQTWEVFRTRVPTDPEEPTERVPEAGTYAYPNPFSPVAAPSGVVRIVAQSASEGGGTATVQLYNFAMDPVRELTGECDMQGRCEVAWDGTGAGGGRVANGVYFYEIEVGGETERGKIMVLE